jgi:hypothetical protein
MIWVHQCASVASSFVCSDSDSGRGTTHRHRRAHSAAETCHGKRKEFEPRSFWGQTKKLQKLLGSDQVPEASGVRPGSWFFRSFWGQTKKLLGSDQEASGSFWGQTRKLLGSEASGVRPGSFWGQTTKLLGSDQVPGFSVIVFASRSFWGQTRFLVFRLSSSLPSLWGHKPLESDQVPSLWGQIP